ncbi:MAG TPA: hypothetical protein VKX24_08095 [Acidimicrobiia bacterium]|nr:hypothetical protein [Acidimicrobiia bacterium]
MERGSVDPGAEHLGEGRHLGQRPGGGHLVAHDQCQPVGRRLGQQPGQLLEAAGHRRLAEPRPGRDVDVAVLVEDVHGDRDEHRPGRRRRRGQERPPQHRRQLAEVADLVLPLGGRPGQAGQVAGEDRLGQQVAPVLLAGGDDHRRAVGQGVGQVPRPAAEPGDGVEVHEARPAAGLGVAVGHGHHHVLLQAEHVVELGMVGQGVDEGQLRRPRVAEAVDDAFGPKHLEQDIPPVGRCHRPSSSWPSLHRNRGRSGQSHDGPGGTVEAASKPMVVSPALLRRIR